MAGLLSYGIFCGTNFDWLHYLSLFKRLATASAAFFRRRGCLRGNLGIPIFGFAPDFAGGSLPFFAAGAGRLGCADRLLLPAVPSEGVEPGLFLKPSFLQTSGLSARGMPGPDVSFSHLLSRAVAKGIAAYLPAGHQPKRLSSFLQRVSEQVALVPGIDAPRPR